MINAQADIEIGPRVIACNAAYGDGGMGKHFAAVVEEARAAQRLERYFGSATKPNDPLGCALAPRWLRAVGASPLLRQLPAWREHLDGELFDRLVAHRLERSAAFVGFAGRTLRSLRRARRLGYSTLVLESGTCHAVHVLHRHRAAVQRWPIEGHWLGALQLRKTELEYAAADLIAVPSEYARQTFLAAGVPPAKLRRRILLAQPRFAPAAAAPRRGDFHILYVGSLTVVKGIPLLLDAFRRLESRRVRLTLVGGFATTAMQRWVGERMAADDRIRACRGDPLPHLHDADVLVHPSFHDGLGLAPLEALACGVPAIVSADTGMKEFVREGVNGFVVPSGDVEALVDRLREVRARPLRGTFTPFGAAA